MNLSLRVVLLLGGLMLVSHISWCQGQNVSLVSATALGSTGSDIWGYVDGAGIEYAVIGSRCHAKVYSLEDPAVPVLRADIPGVCTSWRDFKSHGERIYGITDVSGTDGVLIINMSGAPDSITHHRFNPDVTIGGVTEPLNQCHNLYIDSGYMYLAGCDPGIGDCLIYDLSADPDTPTFVHALDDRYSHDVYVRDDILYTSDINDGQFSIYDITTPTSPSLLGTQMTGRQFTHNAWLSDDGNTIFTTDERADAFVEAYDISDPGNITYLDRHAPIASLNTGTIPHNVHVLNDFLVTSHYTEGVVIVDAAQPDNLIQVGQYDTYTPSNVGFRGNWGAYPFLPSGLLLLSDMQTGLYVLSPNYIRACYLRGVVRDINTNNPIAGVDVQILAPDLNDGETNNVGGYATGVVTPGGYQVVFSHPSYGSDTVGAALQNGVTTLLDHYMGDYVGPCVDSLTLSGIAVTEARVARDVIMSTAVVDSSVTVQYQASQAIELNQGFEVKSGGQLTVNNDGCP